MFFVYILHKTIFTYFYNIFCIYILINRINIFVYYLIWPIVYQCWSYEKLCWFQFQISRGLSWCWWERSEKRKEAREELIYRRGVFNSVSCQWHSRDQMWWEKVLSAWFTRPAEEHMLFHSSVSHRQILTADMLVLLQILFGSSRGPSLWNVIQTNLTGGSFCIKGIKTTFLISKTSQNIISVFIFVSLRYSVLIFSVVL